MKKFAFDPYILLSIHLKGGEIFNCTTQEFLGFGMHQFIHRIDGPAIHEQGKDPGCDRKLYNQMFYSEYWLNGTPLTFDEFDEIINMPLELRLTDSRDWVRDI